MSNLKNEMENYVKVKKGNLQSSPEELYLMADSKIEFAKTYLHKENLKTLKHNLEDLRQDFVTTMFYLEKNNFYKQNKGSKEDFNDLVFDMVLGKYDVDFANNFPAPLYKNPMKNFEEKFKNATYGEFLDFSTMNTLSPLAIAKYLKLPQKQLVSLLQLTPDQIADFKEHDDYFLSTIKVKAPNKK